MSYFKVISGKGIYVKNRNILPKFIAQIREAGSPIPQMYYACRYYGYELLKEWNNLTGGNLPMPVFRIPVSPHSVMIAKLAVLVDTFVFSLSSTQHNLSNTPNIFISRLKNADGTYNFEIYVKAYRLSYNLPLDDNPTTGVNISPYNKTYTATSLPSLANLDSNIIPYIYTDINTLQIYLLPDSIDIRKEDLPLSPDPDTGKPYYVVSVPRQGMPADTLYMAGELLVCDPL